MNQFVNQIQPEIETDMESQRNIHNAVRRFNIKFV